MLKQALKFIATIAVITALAYALLEYTPLRTALASYTAHATLLTLQSLGGQVEAEWLGNPHLVSNKFDAELVPLCWGSLELALWAGVILATDNRSLRRRALGLLAGLSAFAVFNPIRVGVTLKLFDASRPFASFVAHDLLFRSSLLALFVVAYAVWYSWKE